MKREEQKSYALMYLICSVVLVLVMGWGIWNEVVGKRLWKDYQRKFYSIIEKNIGQELEKEKAGFEIIKKQSGYQVVKVKLENARKEFALTRNQNEFNRLGSVIHNIRDKELSSVNLQLTDVRNKVMEAEYNYTKSQKEEDSLKLEKLKEESKELLAIFDKIKERLEEEQKKKSALTADIDKYESELLAFEAPLNKLKEKYAFLKKRRPSLQEYQLHIPDLERVDRCMSCHLGIDKEERVVDEQPFKKHPGSYIFLKNHTLKDFGCTVCHEGQGRATTSVKKAHGEVEYWLKPMFRGRLAQASCLKCHERTDDLPGASLISRGKELFVARGCIGCHDVEGITNIKIGPPLTHIGNKVSYKWLKTWLKNPRDYYKKARMPNFMLSDEEIRNIADFFIDLSKGDKDIVVAANPDVDENIYQKGMAVGVGR